MKTATRLKTFGRVWARAAALCLLALAGVLLQAHEARAQWTTSGTTTSTTNNVGVGTATTPGKLSVAGSDAVPDDTVTLTVPSASVYGPSLKLDATGSAGGRAWTIASTGGSNAGGAGKLRFYDLAAGAVRMILDGSGNVGIGTSSPSQIFQVHSSGTWAGTRVTTAATGSTINDGVNFGYDDAYGAYIWNREASPIIFSTNNAERMRLDASGNIGLGTTTPGILNGFSYVGFIPLHIKGTGSKYVMVDTPDPSSGFALNDSSQPVDSRIWTVSQSAGGGKLTFSTVNDSASVNSAKVVIDRAGNMGVGTTAPTTRLHVAGDITVDGNINAKYQDVAEWVPSTQKLQAGTVVILDSRQENHVTASTTAYDTRVAGVVSARPGIALGEAGEGKALVATTGRVKVRVDATRAPIRIGDLIVTSDIEGVGMKSKPINIGGRRIHAPGTIIGKALEALDKGRGEILVLLSLQ